MGANSRLGAYSNGKRPLLQLFSLVEAITRPGYQASEASNATDEFFIIVLQLSPGGVLYCKASQENIVVPLQNYISVYNDSETPSK